MDYLERALKRSGLVSILESLIIAILGILLTVKTGETLKLLSIVLGIVFMIKGIGKIVKNLVNIGKNISLKYDLIYSLITIVIGLFIIFQMNTVVLILRIIIGIWIIYTSFERVNYAIQMKRSNDKEWIIRTIFAIFMFICGLFILINSESTAIIGIIMIVTSIMNIIEDIIVMRSMKDIF